MSREIKFRAWDGKRMTTSGIQFITSTGVLEFKPIGKLMQYTGLKDKNGKEIYEGDIIKNYWWSIYKEDIGNMWEVKFGLHETSSGDYYASGAYGWYGETNNKEQNTLHNIPNDEGLEVMGNIYENEDLLCTN